MRVIVSLLISGVLAAPSFAQAPAPKRPAARPAPLALPPAQPAGMTNADILKMVTAGLGEEIILGSIQGTAEKSFDLSPNGLIQLKTGGVSDRVILAMQGKPVPPVPDPASAAAPAAAPAPPTIPGTTVAAPREPGIYAIAGGQLIEIESTPVTSGGVGAGSLIASGVTMGFKKVKAKAQVRGGEADLRVDDTAEFYFVGSDFNANDFVLAKLESEDANREIIVGEGGMLGVRNGIRDEDQIPVKTTKLESGMYKVVPSRELRRGEYAFIKIADEENRRLWDFGVDR